MLKAIVSDLATVDESHRGFYAEKDGKFVLQVTPADGFELDNVQGLKSALGAERNLRSGYEEKLRSYEGLDAGTARSALARLTEYGDLDPAKAREAIETAERLSKLDPAKEAERLAEEKVAVRENALKGQFATRETELSGMAEQLKKANETLQTQLKTLMVDNVIKAELAKLNPLDDARDAVELMASRFVQSRQKDGNYVVEVLDANGNPRIKDHHGTPFTVADLVSEIRETRPGLFKPDDTRGIGVPPGQQASTSTTSGQKNPWKRGSWNMTEQFALAKSNPTLAARLKAEAAA